MYTSEPVSERSKMKIIEYGDVPENPGRSHLVKKYATYSIMRKVLDKYQHLLKPEEDKKHFVLHVGFAAQSSISILTLLGSDFENKTFLDLGCGSSDPNTLDFELMGSDYSPWLCRYLHEIGIKAIGIDVGDLSKEEFESHSTDLLVPNALSFIPNNSIDVAHTKLLYDSPELERRFSGKISHNNASSVARRKLNEVLTPQLERIVKTEGYLLYYEVRKHMK